MSKKKDYRDHVEPALIRRTMVNGALWFNAEEFLDWVKRYNGEKYTEGLRQTAQDVFGTASMFIDSEEFINICLDYRKVALEEVARILQEALDAPFGEFPSGES